MPVVCRNRPNRSRPRKLDAKAAARIICATLQERKPEPRLEQVASLRGLSPTIQFVRAVEEYAKNPNWTQADIEEELRERDCGWTPCEDRDPDCERKRKAAVAIAQQLIEGNNRTLAVAEAALQVFDIAVRVAIFAIKSLPWPPARLVGITLDRTATPALARVRTVVRAQRAANDDLFTLVANL